MNNEKVLIGYVCEKGNHTALIGEDLACGSHYYAELYVSWEPVIHSDGSRHTGRGQTPDLESVAGYIRNVVRDVERYYQERW